jgi:hypothetical protein
MRADTWPASRDKARRLRLATAATFAGAAVGVLLAALPAGDDSMRGAGPVAAAAALAAEQPSRLPAPGEYSYLKLRVGSTSDSGASDTEWWVRADQSGRMIESMTGLGAWETPIGDGWRRTGPGSWLNDKRFGPGEFALLYQREAPAVVPFEIDRLPIEPGALHATLRRSLRRAGHDSDPETGFVGSTAEQAQMLILIGQVLAHPLASPQLRSALYSVAGRLPGVTIREDVEDAVGRPGTALSFTQRIGRTTNRHELIFDPATSETLATQLVSREPMSLAPPPKQGLQGAPPALARPLQEDRADAPAGPARRARRLSQPVPPNQRERVVVQRFTHYVVYLARGVVDSPEERP